jgi:protein-tyrosine phosphatase
VSAADYLADLNATDSVAAVFTILADESAYPVDIHCVYGRDRTGVMAAVILLALGATPDDVMTDYRLSASAGLGAYPSSLSAVLDAIAQRGGIEAYLAGAGVDAETLARVRARLITSIP